MNSTRVSQFLSQMAGRELAPAVEGDSGGLSYGDLLAASDLLIRDLQADGVVAGTTCGYLGDYSPETIALFVALMRLNAIAVPLTPAVELEFPRLAKIAGIERLVRFDLNGVMRIERFASQPNTLIESFRKLNHAGLVVFTSGSTGLPKGILHDVDRVLSKFKSGRRSWRTILFLMMDHFGGVNTLLSVLAHGGVAICVKERSPDAVCRAVAHYRAELLPTTPTFLNMIVVSGAWRRHDLSSVRMITYGTEPMTETILRRVQKIFPKAELKQTYGLSELGVLHSQSPDPGSLWLQIGGAGFETRVVDGQLHIRSSSSMVGYLNAPSPIDAEGWMNTGDLVETRDGLIRFLGRVSDVINVGGQKVFPSEIEEVLLEAENVADVTVFGVRHPLLGQAVRARVSLDAPEPENLLAERLQQHCRKRLAKFKIPLRFDIADLSEQATQRAKKRRLPNSI